MYITYNKQQQKEKQISIFDIMSGVEASYFKPVANTFDTVTVRVDKINKALIDKTNFQGMYEALVKFNEKYQSLIDCADKSTLYRSFKIPKRNGKLRQIDAPKEELAAAFKDLKVLLEKYFYASYHTCAFAYVKHRSTLSCVQRHQKNNSRWFLKLDFHGFFPSTTEEFLKKMLYQTFPMCEFIKYDFQCKKELDAALSLCFLNGGLPQGTQVSPMLTNMMMIPIDHAINKYCHEHSPHLCYTRYADDLLISSEFNFTWSEVQGEIVKILKDFGAPFTLNVEKTRYGSSSGRNWNLGVMLNKDNEITVGAEKKRVFKAMVHQFITDCKYGKNWSLEDAQHLQGLYSYYLMIEPEYFKALIKKNNEKFGSDFEADIKKILKASA